MQFVMVLYCGVTLVLHYMSAPTFKRKQSHYHISLVSHSYKARFTYVIFGKYRAAKWQIFNTVGGYSKI